MTRALFLLILLLLTSCRAPSLVPATKSTDLSGLRTPVGHVTAKPLCGTVDMGALHAARSIQATASDIAAAAIVSLINATTGQSVAATVSTPIGGFSLAFGPLFQPANNQVFYLEATKGVQVPGTWPDGLFNQAGADAIRLRTLVYYDGTTGGWHSLVPDAQGLVISNRTTTLTIVIALRQAGGLPVNMLSYRGTIDSTAPVPTLPFSDLGTNPQGYNTPNGYAPSAEITLSDFNHAYAVVKAAIDRDRDPLQYTNLDTSSGNISSSFVSFSVSDVQPRAGTIDTTLTVSGTGFSSGTPVVTINGVTAPIQGTYTDDTLTVKIGPGSRTGPIAVTIDNVLQAGPTVTVNCNDGHQCLLNDKLYVTSPSWGTLAEVAANGDVKTVVTGLGTPRQVVVGPDHMLYVTAETDNKVWKIDPTHNFAQTASASVTAAYGLAFDSSGNYCVSSNQDGSNGAVVKFDSNGNTLAQFTGFTRPQALGFDYAGLLYVVESSGTVTRLAPGGVNGAPRTVMANLTDVRGLAIDSSGALFVASNTNNTIYRVDPNTRGVGVFAMVNCPGSLTFDSAGTMYVSDLDQNLIYRITPAGNLITLAYGLSYPRGLALDPLNGDLFVALSHSNAILKISSGVVSKFVTGIANPDTLTWRGSGLYVGQPDVNTVSFVDRSKLMSTVVTGVPWACGADSDSSGKIYVGLYDTCLTRPDAWQPNRDPLYSARFGIVDTANGNAYSDRYPLLTAGTSTFRAVDSPVGGVRHLYDINQGSKQLTMVTINANGSQTIQKLYTFASPPQEVNFDAAGNLYVAVPSENKVYRFLKASNYAVETIGGFNQPIGMTFDASGAMWVSNRNDGTLRKVTSPATDANAAFTSVAVPGALSAPSDFRGCSYMSGTNYVFVACNKRIARYDIVTNSFSDYLGVDQPEEVDQIWARSTGVLYVKGYQSWNAYTVNADKTLSAWQMTAYGGAFTYAPDWTAWQSGSYGPQIYGSPDIGALALTHEVGVDQARNYLYLAGGCGGACEGGLFRFELGANPKEMYVNAGGGTAHSLAINTTNGDVYVGGSNSHIYLVDTNGACTDKWTVPGSAAPYGMDIINNNQLWVLGSDCKIYDIPVGGALSAAHLYGLMGPSF